MSAVGTTATVMMRLVRFFENTRKKFITVTGKNIAKGQRLKEGMVTNDKQFPE
jgi:hypothetical protein